MTRIIGARKATHILRARNALGDAARRFARDERGSLLILSILIFMTMLVASAMTLDFMRQEEVRQRLQNTADRAALAAADLNQSLNPQDVVDDYFAKEGLSNLDYEVVVEENNYGSSRTVQILADSEINRTFRNFVASEIASLPVRINSKAEESIGKVEISLVLDISGSMDQVPSSSSSGSYTGKTRLQRMVPAAQAFVSQMFDVVQPEGAEPGRLMMSIVPYSTQVALNDALLNAYTISNDYTIINPSFRQEHCVDFHDSDFASLAINPDTMLQRTMYGDSWNWARYTSSRYYGSYYSHVEPNCSQLAANEVLPFSNNETKLLNKIKYLDAGGNTSIDFGAKWGLALLDPSAKLAMTRMISAKAVDSVFAGRPSEYGADADAMKVMVLMTDGANTDAYSTKPEYRSGPSPLKSIVGPNDMSNYVYYDASKGSTPYYNFSTRKWLKASDVTVEYTWSEPCYRNRKWRTCTYRGYKPAEFFDITYEYIYQTMQWNLFRTAELFRAPYGRTLAEQYDRMSERSENNLSRGETEKDDNLHQVCDLARDQGVLVFTIAVDPDSSSYNYADILAQCATSPGYAFSVDSAKMTEAFATIVANINALRLSN